MSRAHLPVLFGGVVLLFVSAALTEPRAQAPPGARIAFHSDRDGNGEIYVMDADGQNVRNLTHHPRDDWNPAWSPDGRSIAFSSTRDSRPDDRRIEIYVMEVAGQNVRRLTHDHASDFGPDWSPDGLRIAWSSEDLNTSDAEIYVMDADGRNARNLTNAPGDDRAPDWFDPAFSRPVSARNKRALTWGWLKRLAMP
jgi:Tol biopolymer transport system component